MVTNTATHGMSQHLAPTIANTTITDCSRSSRGRKTTGYIMVIFIFPSASGLSGVKWHCVLTRSFPLATIILKSVSLQ